MCKLCFILEHLSAATDNLCYVVEGFVPGPPEEMTQALLHLLAVTEGVTEMAEEVLPRVHKVRESNKTLH